VCVCVCVVCVALHRPLNPRFVVSSVAMGERHDGRVQGLVLGSHSKVALGLTVFPRGIGVRVPGVESR